MERKISELEGRPLDWAVDKIFNLGHPWRVYGQSVPAYSTDWAAGGPIIERMMEGHFFFMENDRGNTHVAYGLTEHDNVHGYGPTPLIAAMRCYVASKLGDTIDIPDSLNDKG